MGNGVCVGGCLCCNYSDLLLKLEAAINDIETNECLFQYNFIYKNRLPEEDENILETNGGNSRTIG